MHRSGVIVVAALTNLAFLKLSTVFDCVKDSPEYQTCPHFSRGVLKKPFFFKRIQSAAENISLYKTQTIGK